MPSSPQLIRVRAPATSANLGAGFDCLGLAVDLWNEVQATPGPADNHTNLVIRSARAVFDELGADFPGFELKAINRVPFGRGLGSSATAIACGILIANECLGRPLDEAARLRLATRLEGHPDNVVPCLLGGVRVATVDEAGAVVQAAVPVRLSLRLAAFVPHKRLPTRRARAALPPSIPMHDAAFNIARASLLVAALAGGQPRLLAEATRDRLHQPYRLPLFPQAAELIGAALRAGALGAYTSGAGPSVLALCGDDQHAREVIAAFKAVAHQTDTPGAVLRLRLTQRGAYVVA